MKRRTFLAHSAALGGATLLGTVGATATTATQASGGTRTTETLLAGTNYATDVVTIDAPNDGPAAVVVGGMHGDEPSGYRAASDVASWQFDAGKLVVLPEANRPAIERGTRHNDDGDLNRKFPTGREAETKLARSIWRLIESANPDVVLDLHSSKGVYRTHESAVGQAVFPTVVDPAPTYARAAIETANDTVVPWYMPYHRYERGNLLDGASPLLVDKVAGDLDRPGYIVESTKFILDPPTAARWTSLVAETLLAKHGIPRRDGRVESTAGDGRR
ncbi:succinylglutamate desuccinylase/aspartoacylase family protein [Haloarcula nitratireducens]|uniref:Succinylglutamate desuccinylase/aspartoacylase family protein n=1 Tax=Haloarcula nitratireducens TaxID=2487749 RepID=A0AAW4PBT9_9EURY|nr:succinylglutamate desuccinylase/aspartoacylase family protein [Halomicroarcula nitratireducens]MBX0295192.1 succinylglutamate desuccinylase/aspartoacylase family protein [Halomicroarcula nitratireducens]